MSSLNIQVFVRFRFFNDFAKCSWELIIIFYLAYKEDPEIKQIWFEGKLHGELCKRKKGKHLSAKQRTYICSLLKEFPENHNSIKIEYRLSSATFSRLNKLKYSTFYEPEQRNQNKLRKTSIRTDVQNFIAETVRPPQFPMTVQRIRKAVFEKFGKMYSSHIVKEFLKKILHYSFKKSCSRPPRYMAPSTKVSKGFFWIELLRSIHRQQEIFSVDEWSFTREVKSEYSWLPAGKSSMVINDLCKGRASLIMAAGSNGKWFGIIRQGTINSKIFWIFLRLLKQILQDTEKNKKKKSTIILDNARIHSSNYTKEVVNRLKLELKFLPPYCPEIAPVEHVFRAIKSKLRSRISTKTINFDRITGVNILKETIDSIASITWKNAWSEVIRECSEGINTCAKEIHRRE